MVCHVPGSHQKVNGVSVLNLPGDTALDALKNSARRPREMDTMRRLAFDKAVQSSPTVAKPFAISDLTSGG